MLAFGLWFGRLPRKIDVPQWVNFSYERPVTTNKVFEFQMTQWSIEHLFDLNVDLHWYGRDHAGPSISMSFLGLFINIALYDRRHWHHDKGRWHLPGEEVHPGLKNEEIDEGV